MARTAQQVIESAPIGSTVIDFAKANQNAEQGKGAAVAEMMVDYVIKQGGTLQQFLKDIYNLSAPGRVGFRVAMNTFNKTQATYIKSLASEDQKKEAKRAHATATVRISEAMTFSKACDAMMPEPTWSVGYGRVIYQAREWLRNNAAGNTPAAGRPARPVLDTIKAYITKLMEDGKLTAKQLPQVAELVSTMGKVKAKPKAAPVAKEATSPQAKIQRVSPTRRAAPKAKALVSIPDRREVVSTMPLIDDRRTHDAPAAVQ